MNHLRHPAIKIIELYNANLELEVLAETSTISHPTVFISYSWTSPQHKDWVTKLAKELAHHGVNVELDIWSLHVGQDLFAFMERMVTDSDISKVLIICDKIYAEKADNRRGGVGMEAQIITPAIYAASNQNRFIPILVERTQEGSACLPAYLGSRKYIDMVSPEDYSEGFESILRVIYERPQHHKPLIGFPPEFTDDPLDILELPSTISVLERRRGYELKQLLSRLNAFLKSYMENIDKDVDRSNKGIFGGLFTNPEQVLEERRANQEQAVREVRSLLTLHRHLLSEKALLAFEQFIKAFEEMSDVIVGICEERCAYDKSGKRTSFRELLSLKSLAKFSLVYYCVHSTSKTLEDAIDRVTIEITSLIPEIMRDRVDN